MTPISVITARILASFEKEHLALEQQKLRQVVDFADTLYGDRKHWSGLTLLEYALGVLRVLLPFQPDAETVTACLLQFSLDTKSLSTSELEEEFGPRVRELVSGVHLLSQVNLRSRQNSIENLRLMLR